MALNSRPIRKGRGRLFKAVILQEVYDRILQFRYRGKLRHSLFAGIICSIHGSAVRIGYGDRLPEGVGHIDRFAILRIGYDRFVSAVTEQKMLSFLISGIFGHHANAVSAIVNITKVIPVDIRCFGKAVIGIVECDSFPIRIRCACQIVVDRIGECNIQAIRCSNGFEEIVVFIIVQHQFLPC